MLKTGFILSVSVEVRYDRGIGYLNKCGLLAQKLADQLGAPFRLQGIPTVDVGELRSDAERITVRFGRESFNVTQLAPQTAAPVESVAPELWRTVRDELNVDRFITRAGFRVVYLWPAPSIDEARTAVKESGLVATPHKWSELFGQPSWSTITAVTSDERIGQSRITVDAVEQRVEGLLPAGYDAYYPSAAVQLDVDYVYPDEQRKHYPLGHGQLRDFMRGRWEAAKKLRLAFTSNLTETGSL